MTVGRGTAIAVLLLFPALEVRAQVDENPDSLRLLSWNVSWFAHPAFPPADDEQQLENVLTVLRHADADLVALQEIASLTAFEELVERLGPDYAGLTTRNAGDQQLGVIYRHARVEVIEASDVPFGAASHEFAGRPPLFLEMTIGNSVVHTLLLVVVHLKAFSDPESYERRLQSVRLLATYLESLPRDRHVLLAGDFNDSVERSSAFGRDSPLRALSADTARYLLPTRGWENARLFTYCATPACDEGAVFDHFVLSRSLDGWSPTVRRMDAVLDLVPAYAATTSDHLPISLTLVPPTPAARTPSPRISLEAYPSPFENELTVAWEDGDRVYEVELIDMLGRTRLRVRPSAAGPAPNVVLRTSGLESGVYVVRARGALPGEGLLVFRVR